MWNNPAAHIREAEKMPVERCDCVSLNWRSSSFVLFNQTNLKPLSHMNSRHFYSFNLVVLVYKSREIRFITDSLSFRHFQGLKFCKITFHTRATTHC